MPDSVARILVLGIETSCDETAASLVELDDRRLRVRSSVVGSQTQVHAPYGGVVPELASRAHLERLLPVIRRAMVDAALGSEATTLAQRLGLIDAIAVGSRPGLIGSLLVGTSAAKALAWSLRTPFLGVDHVAAHLVAAMLDAEPIDFPALGLVVSGGHTSLFLMRSPLELEPLARTPDDAVGEAFDKGAALLGLKYPGGPEVERLAEQGRADACAFAVPRLDFSFSGLKTALLREVRGMPPARGRMARPIAAPPPLTEQRRADLAASYQRALVRAVVKGVEHAWDRMLDGGRAESLRSLVVGGGVSANRLMRAELSRLADARGVSLRLAPLKYCVDNAAMIAGLGALRAARGERDALDLAPQPLSTLATVVVPPVVPPSATTAGDSRPPHPGSHQAPP